MKKTKIICTIGPSINKKNLFIDLINFGMDIMRLNFSHGNYDDHKKNLNNLIWAEKITGKNVSVILDTKGPEIRTLKFNKIKEIYLKTDQFFSIICDDKFLGNEKKIGISYKNFINEIEIGSLILIDDGLISMKVISIDKNNNEILCRVLNNGILGENKGINLPGISINLPFLSNKDKADLIFGCNNNIDFIAASFVRNKLDVLEIKNFLNNNNGKNIKIISKIENKESLKNFDSILNVSDGIMIARGDLGVEIPVEDVILHQKSIIKKCNFYKKIVITATQMLESMILNPRPTRAEAGDVSNAILDGTDAVMLSGETAKGKYPIESVKIMSKICKRTDLSMINFCPFYKEKNIISTNEIVCKSAVDISKKLKSPLILVFTRKGKTVMFLRKYFPSSFILALTNNKIISKQLLLVRGVFSFFVNDIKSVEDFYNIGKKLSLSKNYVTKGDIIIMVSGYLFSINTIKTISLHII